MARRPQLSRHILLYILTAILLGGCAISPGSLQSPEGEPVPITTLSVRLQKALDAVEEGDHAKAARLFDKALKKDGEIQEEYLYDYGLALSETGRYEEAVEQLTAYIDDRARRGLTSPEAAAKRAEAGQKLVATPRTEKAEANLRRIGKAVDDNWQLVLQQLAAGATSFTEPLTGIELVLIGGGCYPMGDQFGDGEADERPVHEACVDDFYIGRYEVTQEQWLRVMGYNPSEYPQGGAFPVDTISWREAAAFADALSGNGGGYRLPTEAEWEYAARSGGRKQKFSGGDKIDEVAWHRDNSERRSHPVGRKKPNGLGLYDMSGNVAEWCLDRYGSRYYGESPKLNPAGVAVGNERARRGGGWGSKATFTRTSYRGKRDEGLFRNSSTGFRLALPVPTQAIPGKQ